MISERVATLKNILSQEDGAMLIVEMWDRYKRQIQTKLDETAELRNFVYATDTGTTSNAELGDFAWKNNTHLPKLCEVMDNLVAIYKATWFPNDNWMKWEAYAIDDETREKKSAIEGYMRNKVMLSDFEQVVGDELSNDYVLYGNAFGCAHYRDDTLYANTGQVEKFGYQGPVAARISPEDIAFDLTAASFKDSPKVIRTIKTVGDLVLLAEQIQEKEPERANKIMENIGKRGLTSAYTKEDFNKANAYSMDGFGNFYDYFDSGYVEILEFRGTLYDPTSKQLKRDYVIQVMDRTSVIYEGPWHTSLRDGGIYHVGYRKRPDNLWHMGPLDNLVGMQYRIDHLQGAKDDNIDLHLHPTKVITGDPDETEYGPNKEIRLNADAGESVDFISPDLSPMQLDSEIQFLLQLMEEFVGSPKQSRGFRTPGEKTLGEVSLLETNSNRLFLDKAIKFEKEMIEPMLNGMLAIGKENFNTVEQVQVFDSELGVMVMAEITEKDLQADGLLRPIGARHFGQRNQQLQNLMNIYNSGLGQKIDQHISSKQLADLVNDNLQLDRFGLVSPYAALFEQGDAQRVASQVQRQSNEEASVDTDIDIEEEEDDESI